MTSPDDDDKPTVVLDLNALKKEKLAKEEELANMAHELEFAVGPESKTKNKKESTEEFTENFLLERAKLESAPTKPKEEKKVPIILFDFNSDLFQNSKAAFPQGYEYHFAKTLPELNKFLATKKLQIVVFNYDAHPKAVNQLSAQIKQKFPMIRTMIIAKAISPEKAAVHAKSQFGASGYLQLPLEAQKISSEFQKIISKT